LALQAMAIELIPPADADAATTTATWTARYWYASEDVRGALAYRDWFSRESQNYFGSTPRLVEESRTDARIQETGSRMAGTLVEERVPLIVTALVIFALYLCSFNLYIASTAEEREKRMLLGLLLSPASPVEVIAAKAIFYASASLVLSLAVAATYQPLLLLRPLLWGAVIVGSVGYVAIGTVIVCIVRRQTTMNTIPMLYLISTSIIMFLSNVIPLFIGVRVFLMEHWLYFQLQQVIAGESPRSLWLVQLVLLALVSAWTGVAIRIFRQQGMLIAQGR
jgi:ABC-type Na+ efflux pump permease subunit